MVPVEMNDVKCKYKAMSLQTLWHEKGVKGLVVFNSTGLQLYAIKSWLIV